MLEPKKNIYDVKTKCIPKEKGYISRLLVPQELVVPVSHMRLRINTQYSNSTLHTAHKITIASQDYSTITLTPHLDTL